MLRGVVLLILFLFSPSLDFSGKVIKVLDGDTIEVLSEGNPTRIRLNGIDCPEKSQAFGTAAKEFTATLIAGRQVFVKHRGLDRYNRVLGDVYILSGKDSVWLNRSLVEAGYAWHYKRYSDDQRLSSAEINAQKQRVGLWVETNPIPPWDFRKINR